jgi:hypothetical protein
VQFSEYIIYVDESGDHSLESVDEQYPIFVLALCIFKKDEYAATAVPFPRQKGGMGKEDQELELEFRRIIEGKHILQRGL